MIDLRDLLGVDKAQFLSDGDSYVPYRANDDDRYDDSVPVACVLCGKPLGTATKAELDDDPTAIFDATCLECAFAEVIDGYDADLDLN